MIEVSHLCKSYGSKQAIQDVSFSVASGEIKAFGEDIRQNPTAISNFGILLECAFLDYLNAYENFSHK